ncbi:hypothetical protein C6Q09_19330 [Burkholderia multivorans]|uniref:ankyrin repeat domain-containing protein n=1 Tax=Burkholderia multivorans TaxID=87883 RepID=UPI000CFE4552|nr:ankyrin repeat domain-containing protein [Burkholderia multivorans]PRF67829.1 hypothetical protein C6Q09_19330 [Burkholderia multivorans]
MDNNYSFESLYRAAISGDLNTVAKCLEAGANLEDKNHALRESIEKGHIEVARYLLKHGADIHRHKERALNDALNSGKLDMVSFLVENGADIHAVKERAFITAARRADYPLMRYLLSLDTDPKLDLRTAPEEVKQWVAQYINSITLNNKLQSTLPEKKDKQASKVNDGKL